MFSPEAEAKFFHRIDRPADPAKCWRWVGSRLPSGYGQFRPVAGGAKVYSHRWSQERWNGPIPEGWQVDHLCRNKWCCNPAHLEAVTPQTNVRRGFGWTEDDEGWTCNRGHFLGWLKDGDCPICQEIHRQKHRSIHGHEKRTPGSHQRALQRERDARRAEFMKAYPEVPAAEIDSIGLTACRRRIRAGWTWSTDGWVKP